MEQSKQAASAFEEGGGFSDRRIRKIPELVWACRCGRIEDYFRTGEIQYRTCSCGKRMILRLRGDCDVGSVVPKTMGMDHRPYPSGGVHSLPIGKEP